MSCALKPAAAIVALLVMLLGAARGVAQDKVRVSLASLLNEMTDRNELARSPAAEYTVGQASSYDRRQKTPDDPASWFANQDGGNVIRVDAVGDRREWVILDQHGPGCITRMWTPNANSGAMRVYLDGDTRPAIEGDLQEVLGGHSFVKPPLAIQAVRAGDFYLPIPYQKSCKITLNKEPFYYAIQYRAYAPGTVVETFSREVLAAQFDAVGRAAKSLQASLSIAGAPPAASLKSRVEPHASAAMELPAGGGAVKELRVRLTSSSPAGVEQALRSTVLKIVFDDESTVWCPLGDFFGRGIAGKPYADWSRTVAADGTMSCRWVMPYERSASIELQNLSDAPIEVDASASTTAWKWDERSLHFHANWRQQYPLNGAFADWNYLEAQGSGRYVGDTLTTMNPTWSWWGEGDERVYVDGAKFPQLNGTGLEDYYGYAWGIPDFFQSQFLSCSRVRFTPVESEHVGHTTVSRLRSLDAIPFRHSLRYDMEISCIGKNDGMAWAVATFWYGRPGAKSAPTPSEAEAARPLPYPPGLSRRHLKEPLTQAELVRIFPNRQRLTGAIECEDMMRTATAGVDARQQEAYKWDPNQKFSNGDFLHVDAHRPGDYVELKIPIADAMPRKYVVYAARGPGFSSIRFEVNGKRVEGEYDEAADVGGVSIPIDLGAQETVNGMLTLRAVVVKAARTAPAGAAPFGLDCVVASSPP
jgi:hypothetical protein